MRIEAAEKLANPAADSADTSTNERGRDRANSSFGIVRSVMDSGLITIERILFRG